MVHKNSSNLKHLHQSFNYLHEENIISKESEHETSVKVVYWSRVQWENIKKSALEIPLIEAFVK